MRPTTSLLLLFFLPSIALAQLDYQSFVATSGLTLAGSASVGSSGEINLTPIVRGTAGAVWSTKRQYIRDGFITRFRFRISDTLGQPDPVGSRGGDGIAFVVQGNDGPSATGGVGGEIGYGRLTNCVAVEFDTYTNGDPFFDPNNNHAAIHVGGVNGSAADRDHQIAINTSIPDVSDGRLHTVTIEYVPGRMVVYLDNCTTPILQASLTIHNIVQGDTAWVGIASATGAAWERHDLYSWTFNSLGARTIYTQPICVADSVTLYAPGNFVSYLWSSGETTRSITARKSGRYTLTVVDSVACSRQTWSTAYDIVLGPPPAPRIVADGPLRFCQGGSVELESADSFATYSWSSGGNGRSVRVSRSGMHYLVVTDGRGCRGIDSVRVIVDPPPTVAILSGGPREFCEGDSVVLTAGDGLDSVRWSTGDRSTSIVARSAGRYVLTGYRNGCLDSASVEITVYSIAPPRITPARTTLCDGDSIQLDGGAGHGRYLWSTGESTRTIVVTSSGSYWVEVVDGFGHGCQARSDTATIIVRPRPRPVISAVDSGSGCDARAVLTAPAGYLGYLWSNGATTRSITVTRAGRYAVRGIDSFGCAGVSDSIDVGPFSSTRVSISSSSPRLCVGDTLLLSASEGYSAYLWSSGDTSRQISTSAGGRFWVIAHDTAGCTSSDSIDIVLYDRPVAIASDDMSICAGDSVLLTARGGSTYSWIPIEDVDCPTCDTTWARPRSTTTYLVTVTNESGCSSVDSVTVSVSDPIDLVVTGGGVICHGDSVWLEASGGDGKYLWTPADGLDCSDCPGTWARPTATTTYSVTSTGGACVRAGSATILVDSVGVRGVAGIDSTLRAIPGESFAIPIRLDDPLDAASIDSLSIELSFSERLLRLDEPNEVAFSRGTLLDGWRMRVDETRVDGVRLTWHAPSGRTLIGFGVLFRPSGMLFIGDSASTAIDLRISASGARCVTIEPRSGRAAIDSVCGLSWRLIEVGASRYSLDEPRPNPASTTAIVGFSVGLDGMTRVRIFDDRGAEVRRLVDGWLAPGTYEAAIDARDIPPGVYIVRFESGDYFESRRLVLSP